MGAIGYFVKLVRILSCEMYPSNVRFTFLFDILLLSDYERGKMFMTRVFVYIDRLLVNEVVCSRC